MNLIKWDGTVTTYIEEEVRRQGHDIWAQDGIARVSYMLDAWRHAIRHKDAKPTVWDVEILGKCIEPRNYGGFRRCNVIVGGHVPTEYQNIPRQMVALMESQDNLTPLEFYKAFEVIHPFEDGNGRTGKVLLNWLNKTLFSPVFPPPDFWGRPIQNP